MTPTPAATPTLDRLSVEDLLAELRGVTRERAEAAARRDRLAADLARRGEEQAREVTRAQRRWGANMVVTPAHDAAGDRLRAELAAVVAGLPALDDWRAEVLAALHRRIVREEAAIAEQRAGLDRDAATVAVRQGQLRELWQPLAEYEGLPAGDPPSAGATQRLALGLRAGREQLDRRAQQLARLRGALARAERAGGTSG